jgi:hypothetical protein
MMKTPKKTRCLIKHESGIIKGTIIKEYEEMGGPDDGAEFIVIKLDQGEEITIKISDIQTITRDKPK